jgi:hypothetical protein
MKIDWHKDTGTWSIYNFETGELLGRAKRVRINIPSELVITDGGRHGYLVMAGRLSLNDDTATITKG